MAHKTAIYAFILMGVLALVGVNAAPAFAAASRAEGTDRSAAARANSWTGMIIGINEGERILVITEGKALDHIKAFAQRSIVVSEETEIIDEDGDGRFELLDVGMRIKVWGDYDAKKRIIDAERIEVGDQIAKAPVITNVAPAPTSAVEAEKEEAPAPIVPSITASLRIGSRGKDVITLQQFLINQGMLKLPKGTKLGTYGSMTVQAVKKYQKKNGIPTTGTIGPQTRSQLNEDLR